MDPTDANHAATMAMLARMQEPAPIGGNGQPYDQNIDRVAAMRRMLPVLKEMGIGHPAGVVPGAVGMLSDLYGLFSPSYQRMSTDATRDMYRQQQTIRDAEGQPGGFYGNRK